MKLIETKQNERIAKNQNLTIWALCKINGVHFRLLTIRTEIIDIETRRMVGVFINCDTKTFDICIYNLEEVRKWQVDGTLIVLEEEPGELPVIKPGELEELKFIYALIKEFLDEINPYYEMLQQRGYEKPEFTKLIRKSGMSEYQIRKRILRYLQGGGTLEFLADRRFGNGTSKNNIPQAVRGRKKNSKSSEAPFDLVMEQHFKEAFSEYKRACNEKQYSADSKRKPSLTKYYRDMMIKYYTVVTVEGLVVIPENQRPSYRRFYYWVKKQIDNEKLKTFATSAMDKFNNRRLLTGTANTGVYRLGEIVEVDEHEIPVVLLSALDDEGNQVVGDPIVYLAIDVFTRCILGFSVNLQVNNSYIGILNLMDSMLMDDEANARINMSVYSRPVLPGPVIPETLRCDQGAEYTSKAFRENLTGGNDYGTMEGIPVNVEIAPPAAGSLKGIVEGFFGGLDRKLYDAASNSNGSKSHAYGSNHEKKAVLTIEKARQLTYLAIAEYNNSYSPGYPATPEILQYVPEMTPLALWEYFLKNFGSHYKATRQVVEKMRYGLLLKDKNFNLSRRQISYRDYLYFDIEKDKEFTIRAKLLGDKRERVEIRYDPRTVMKVYRRDEKGQIHIYPLAEKKEHLRYIEQMNWKEVDKFIRELKDNDRIQKEKKEELRIKTHAQMKEIVDEAAGNHSGKNIVKDVKEAGKRERQVVNIFDSHVKDQYFGQEEAEPVAIGQAVYDSEYIEVPEEDREVSLEVDFSKFFPED